MITQCPLCDDSQIQLQRINGKDSVEVTCRRCGKFQIPSGKFEIRQDLRTLLSIYTRTRSTQGERAVLGTDNIDALTKEVEAIPLDKKIQQLLDHFQKRSSYMGDWIALDVDLNWPLFYSRNPQELGFLLEHLRNEQLLEFKPPPFQHPAYRLTIQGWQKLSGEKLSLDRRAPDLDAVTEVRSRKQWNVDWSVVCSEAKDRALPLSLLVIDLDKFKTINEQAGHDGADKILRAVAQFIQLSLQGKGTVYRYGGDELVAILPNFELAEAEAVAERLRKGVEQLQHSPPGVISTVTIGIAAYPDPVSDPKDIFAAADKALLDTKQMGNRNTCLAASTTSKAARASAGDSEPSQAWKLTVYLKPVQPMPIPEHELLEYLIRCSYSLPLDFGRRYAFPLIDQKKNFVKAEHCAGAVIKDSDRELSQLYEVGVDGSIRLTIEQKYAQGVRAVMGDHIFNGLLRFVPFADLYCMKRRYRHFRLEVKIEGIFGALFSVNTELLFTPNWISNRKEYAWQELCDDFLLGRDGMTEFLLKIMHSIASIFSPQAALARSALNQEWIRKELSSYLRIVNHPDIGPYR